MGPQTQPCLDVVILFCGRRGSSLVSPARIRQCPLISSHQVLDHPVEGIAAVQHGRGLADDDVNPVGHQHQAGCDPLSRFILPMCGQFQALWCPGPPSPADPPQRCPGRRGRARVAVVCAAEFWPGTHRPVAAPTPAAHCWRSCCSGVIISSEALSIDGRGRLDRALPIISRGANRRSMDAVFVALMMRRLHGIDQRPVP